MSAIAWSQPWPLTGRSDPQHVRVSSTDIGEAGRRHCPEYRAFKTRPNAYPQAPFTDRRYPPHNSFLLGIVRDAIIAVEQGDLPSPPGTPLHTVAADALDYVLAHGDVKGDVPEAARRWIRHAVETYLDASEALAVAEGLTLGPPNGWAVTSSRAGQTSELFAWGLAYASADGSLRELRLLRIKPHTERPPADAAGIAAAAYVAATGTRMLDTDRYGPFIPAPHADPAPQRVRVREVALLNGRDNIVWEGTPLDAEQRWRAIGAPLVPALVNGGGLIPSRDCAKCKAATVCDALPIADGLLGLPSNGTHPRTLSMSSLSTWDRCPAQYLYKEMGLPREQTPSTPARERGIDVHAWLEHAHNRQVACSLVDLPETESGEVGEIAVAAGLDTRRYEQAHPFLVQHVEACPFNSGRVIQAWPERDLAVRDSDADVLVLHKPDLLLSTLDGPVVRETKTVGQLPVAADDELLAAYPQIALAVCAVGDDGLGDPRLAASDASSAVVELELLGPARSRLVRFDARDEHTLALARRALAIRCHDWHRDDTFEATPGAVCGNCEVRRWCPDAREDGGGPGSHIVHAGEGLQVDARTGEVLGDDGRARPVTAAEAAAAAAALVPTDAAELPEFDF